MSTRRSFASGRRGQEAFGAVAAAVLLLSVALPSLGPHPLFKGPGTSSPGATSTSTPSPQVPSTGASVLTVDSRWANGTAMAGMYAVLYRSGEKVASAYTPANFKLADGKQYEVEVEGYGSARFQYWGGTGSVDALRNITATSAATVTAVFCDAACSDASTAPPPSGGVTVYANRVPASYWAPCFANACSAGTGPGAAMFFQLTDSSGTVLETGFADEWGVTFTGLTPGATYYLFAENCDLCHGSSHDVVLSYWTGGTLGGEVTSANPIPVEAGDVVEAWYSCTNGCA